MTRLNLFERIEHIALNFVAFGVPNFLRAKRFFQKLMWLIFVVVCFSGACYLANSIMGTYFEYEKVTSTETIYEQPIPLPTISFCSFDRKYFNGKELTTLISSCEFSYDTRCKDNSEKYFEEYNDLDFGKCFRFNSGKNMLNETIPILKSTIGGMDDSLKLVLKAPTGLAVWFHNSSNPIFREYKNNHVGEICYVSAGSETHFQIERIVEKKLDEPYNQCLNDVSMFTQNKTIIDYFRTLKRSYNREYCIQYCFDLYYLAENKCKCNASLGNVWSNCFGNGFNHNLSSSKCIIDFKKEFYRNLNDKCSKYCPLECMTIFLEVTSSNIIDKNIDPSSYFYVSTNETKFFAYYKNLKTRYITQKSKLTNLDMISNIGGTFSLFIGISFVSVVQLFELLSEIILAFFDTKKIENSFKNCV